MITEIQKNLTRMVEAVYKVNSKASNSDTFSHDFHNALLAALFNFIINEVEPSHHKVAVEYSYGILIKSLDQYQALQQTKGRLN